MKLELLGPVRVDGDADALSPRDRTILAALAVDGNAASSVDRLTDALWGEEPPASRRKIVQGCVSRLRRALGSEAIATGPDGYRLTLDGDEVDVSRFERLVEQGRELLVLGEPDRAAHVAGSALELWRGEPFADLDDWEAGRVERARLLGLRAGAEELRVEAMIRAGRPREGLAPAARLVRREPLREARWGLLARAQYQCGDQAAALATLRQARSVLAGELGIDPSEGLAELERQILAHDDDLAVPPAAAAAASCPYPGLVPFDEDDADEFFGRDAAVEEGLRRLGREGVLAVVGPSGSGKSSLVRAGIAARLRRNGRRVVVVGPGDRLDEATEHGDVGEVLVVDQVEALLAADRSDEVRRRRLAVLVEWSLRGPLVLAIRADRLADVTVAPIADVVERGLLLLGPLDADGLRAAVEEPARRAGLLVEPGLTDLLVSELDGEPGALPVLAHVLRATWERREGRTLTVAGLTAAGGVRGAVAKTAEDVHDRLSVGQRARLKELLLRMVVRDEDGSLVTTAVPAAVLDGDDELTDVVRLLTDERLLTVDDAHVQLAHEAVTRAWPRLVSWLDEDVEGQRVLRHLSVVARSWDGMGRPDSELYRGVRLRAAVAWREQSHPHLSSVEDEFLDAAVAHDEREQREIAERAARTARANTRLRRSLVGVAVLTVVAMVSAVVATGQARRADRESLAADARRLSAQALITDDADTALLLAVEAVHRDDSPGTRANLLATLGQRPQLIGVTRPDGAGDFGRVSISPDDDVVATYDERNTLRFHSLTTGEQLATIDYDDDALASVGSVEGATELVTGGAAFHPAGGPIAVGVATLGRRPVRLLDPVTFEEEDVQPAGFPFDDMLPWAFAWSPVGDRLAAVFEVFDTDGISTSREASFALVWEAGELADPLVFRLPEVSPSLAWSPDGRVLYTGARVEDADATPGTIGWDAATGDRLTEHPDVAHPLAITPDGSALVGASTRDRGASVVVVDLEGGVLQTTPLVAGARHVAVSPDGESFAVSSVDGRVLLHDRRDGQLEETLLGHAGAALGAAYTADGDTLVSVGTDRALHSWDLTGDRRLLELATTSSTRPHQGFSPNLEPIGIVSRSGETVAFVSSDRTALGGLVERVQLLQVGTGRLVDAEEVSAPDSATGTWLPGERFATVSGRGISALDGRSGAVVAAVPIAESDRLAVAEDAGEVLAMDEAVGSIQRLLVESLDPVDRPTLIAGLTETGVRLTPQYLAAAAATADGRLVATFGGDFPRAALFGLVRPPSDVLVLVDVDGARLERTVDLGFDGLDLAVSPDGTAIAVVGREGRFALVDVATGDVTSPTAGDHDGDVVSVEWLSEGALVVTGGEDGRVSLWDGATAVPLGSVQVARPGDAAFVGATDQHTALVATSAGTVHRFDTRLEHWIEAACSIAGRDLTEAEWREALGDEPYRATCSDR